MPIDPSKVQWDAPDPGQVQWDDAPKNGFSAIRMVQNVPGSAANLVGGLAKAITSPLETIGGVMDIGAGALRSAMPTRAREFIDRFDPNPQGTQRAQTTANAVGQFYKDRYGSGDAALQSLQNDPVGVLADASTILGLGGGAIGKVPGLAKAGEIATRASNLTNPLTLMAKGAGGLARAGGTAASELIGGLGTHTGGESIRQAAKAGAAGGDKAASFAANLRGSANIEDVIQPLKSAVGKLREQRSQAYQAAMQGVNADKAVLSFDGVDTALAKAMESATFKGQVKNTAAFQAVRDIGEEVAKWKGLDPAEFHTPAGLDALKQRIGGMVESIPFEQASARRAAGDIYNALKSEISKQAPTYSKTMGDYSEASNLIGEIEKSLSLGQKATADTAIRKLQSILRNNANTNYGNRTKLLDQLQQSTGADVMPALAGQALNSWAPRGLGKVVSGVNAGAAFGSPELAALLPFQSPRLMGEAAFLGGKLSRPVRGLLGVGSGVDPLAPLTAAEIGLLSNIR